MNKIIYVDNAATTKMSKPVLEAMLPFFSEEFGNPSSIYSLGRKAAKLLVNARSQIASLLGADEKEIYFTASGTEADNWAILGAARRMAAKGKRHIITTEIEHHAVLHCVQSLEKEGFNATYLKPEPDGIVSAEAVRNAMTEDTALVTVMFANNEIGTIQPISEIAGICREKGVIFHTDAVQAVGQVPINLHELGVDLLSLSAHKFHGPKGVGALFVRRGIALENLMFGGGQERGFRPATENIAGIAGMAKALEIATKNINERTVHLSSLRDKLLELISDIPKMQINGSMKKRLPGNLNVSFEGIEGEAILLMLDSKGICASSGSACTSGSLDPSHVLLSIGLPHEIAHGSLRISFSDENTAAEVDYVAGCIHEVVARLREMSPVWENINSK